MKKQEITETLTAPEQKAFTKHETAIRAGRKTFERVARALMAIRDGKLYRAKFGSFAEYCAKRWGMTRQHGYEICEAQEVIDRLKNVRKSDIFPNPGQASELAQLPPDEQPAAWVAATDEAAATGKPITAKTVRSVVRRRQSHVDPIPMDAEIAHSTGGTQAPEQHTPEPPAEFEAAEAARTEAEGAAPAPEPPLTGDVRPFAHVDPVAIAEKMADLQAERDSLAAKVGEAAVDYATLERDTEKEIKALRERVKALEATRPATGPLGTPKEFLAELGACAVALVDRVPPMLGDQRAALGNAIYAGVKDALSRAVGKLVNRKAPGER